MRRIAHQTTGAQKHAVEAGSGWEFQPGDRVLADGLPGVVGSVDDTNPFGIESYEVTLDHGLGGGEYTAAQLQRPQSTTARLVDQQLATESLAIESASSALASHWYPELGSILTDRLPNERIEVTAGLRRTAGQADHEQGREHGLMGVPGNMPFVQRTLDRGRTLDEEDQDYVAGHAKGTEQRAQRIQERERTGGYECNECAGTGMGVWRNGSHCSSCGGTGSISSEEANKVDVLHHLTDNPNFKPDPHFVPEDNAVAIHQRERPGLFAAKPDHVEHWVSEHGYDRPYVAEIHVPRYAHEPGRWGGERFIPAEHLDKATVTRVMPRAQQHTSAKSYPHGHVNGTEITDHEYPGESGIVRCRNCDKYHSATYDHDGQFGGGRVHAAVCPDDQLTDYYTDDVLHQRPKYPARGSVKPFTLGAAVPPDAANEDGSAGLGNAFDSSAQPDACSWCGNPGPWVDEQDTGRGTRIRCGTCGGTMRINTDVQSGTSGIQWTPEFNNSPENHASRQGDPRATTSDFAAVHSSLNAAATQQAGYAIFHEPELTSWLDHQLHVTAASLNGVADEDFVFQFTATWADVRKKATRIRSEGGVRILSATNSGVVGEVQGDNAIYESALNYVPGSKKIADWQCGCKWAAYAWGRSKAYQRFEGRQCSHVLALQYEAQSRGMFGRDVAPDRERMDGQPQYAPVTVQYQRPTDRHPGGDINRRTVPPGNMRSQWGPDSRVRVKGALAYQYEDVPPTHEWARLFTALGTPPSEVIHALHSLGVPHSAARAAIDWATKSLASAVVATEDGTAHTAVHVADGLVHTASGRVVPADGVRLVLAVDKNHNGIDDAKEVTADPGQGEPGTDIPRIELRDQSDAKRKKHHLLHHTNDGRMHAPNFGYGLPWGGSFMWCDQCNGSGCGHCGGTGQVQTPADGSPGPSELSTTNSPVADQSVDAGDMIGDSGGGMSATGARHTADYSISDFGAGNPAQTYQHVTPHAFSPNPASTGWAASADPQGWTQPLIDSSFGRWESMLHQGFVMTAEGDQTKPPSVAGVALKAADTGRVLMIQRSNNDEKDPARGTWEFPGGHREDGDLTSLHAGIREFEEEVGQPFPEGGHVTHVHRNGPYVLHTVVVPKESEALDFGKGRSTVNPDDPKGTEHEQSAWWDPEHARKNPALRQECKSSPWGEIKKAASQRFLTVDEARAASGASSPAEARQMLHEHHQWQESYFPAAERVASPWMTQATLNDEPEGALPSTDGAAEDDDDVAMALGYGGPEAEPEAVPGVPVDRAAPWGYPESAADHPNPAVAQPGSADQTDDGDVANDPGSILHSESSIQVPDQVPPEMAATAAASPIVAGFMQTAGFRALVTDSGPQSGGVAVDGVPNDSDIAAAARDMLTKTSMKSFTFAEQQDLINEGGGKARARNFGDLRIAGTHYEKMGEDDAPDDEFFLL